MSWSSNHVADVLIYYRFLLTPRPAMEKELKKQEKDLSDDITNLNKKVCLTIHVAPVVRSDPRFRQNILKSSSWRRKPGYATLYVVLLLLWARLMAKLCSFRMRLRAESYGSQLNIICIIRIHWNQRSTVAICIWSSFVIMLLHTDHFNRKNAVEEITYSLSPAWHTTRWKVMFILVWFIALRL